MSLLMYALVSLTLFAQLLPVRIQRDNSWKLSIWTYRATSVDWVTNPKHLIPIHNNATLDAGPPISLITSPVAFKEMIPRRNRPA